MSSRLLPPVAARRAHTRTHHGQSYTDPYAWMRDKTAPEFVELLRQENAYAEAATADQEALRLEIFGDISARTRQTDLSVAEFVRHPGLGEFWYYARTTEGDDYPRFYRCPATGRDSLPDPDAPPPIGEELLLDAQRLAEGRDFFALGTFAVSPNGRRLAYSVDDAGDERYGLRFWDFDRAELLPDQLDGIAAGGVWVVDKV